MSPFLRGDEYLFSDNNTTRTEILSIILTKVYLMNLMEWSSTEYKLKANADKYRGS